MELHIYTGLDTDFSWLYRQRYLYNFSQLVLYIIKLINIEKYRN